MWLIVPGLSVCQLKQNGDWCRAQEESDVFGDTLQSAVTKHEDGPSADVHKGIFQLLGTV